MQRRKGKGKIRQHAQFSNKGWSVAASYKAAKRIPDLLFAYRGNRFIIRSRTGNRVLCAKWPRNVAGEPPAERERKSRFRLSRDRSTEWRQPVAFLASLHRSERNGESELDRLRAKAEERRTLMLLIDKRVSERAASREARNVFGSFALSFLFLSFFLSVASRLLLADGVLEIDLCRYIWWAVIDKMLWDVSSILRLVWFVRRDRSLSLSRFENV